MQDSIPSRVWGVTPPPPTMPIPETPNPVLAFLLQLARIEAELATPHPHSFGPRKPTMDTQGPFPKKSNAR